MTLAALQKEEEEFLKLEAMFMSELGIDQATLPPAPPITKV